MSALWQGSRPHLLTWESFWVSDHNSNISYQWKKNLIFITPNFQSLVHMKTFSPLAVSTFLHRAMEQLSQSTILQAYISTMDTTATFFHNSIRATAYNLDEMTDNETNTTNTQQLFTLKIKHSTSQNLTMTQFANKFFTHQHQNWFTHASRADTI